MIKNCGKGICVGGFNEGGRNNLGDILSSIILDFFNWLCKLLESWGKVIIIILNRKFILCKFEEN